MEKEWKELALHHALFRLNYFAVEPDSNQSRLNAEEISKITGISAGEAARFINALLRGHIGKTVTKHRAEQIAMAWCLANKKKVARQWGLDPDMERELIMNIARAMGVEQETAIAFNDFLGSLLV